MYVCNLCFGAVLDALDDAGRRVHFFYGYDFQLDTESFQLVPVCIPLRIYRHDDIRLERTGHLHARGLRIAFLAFRSDDDVIHIPYRVENSRTHVLILYRPPFFLVAPYLRIAFERDDEDIPERLNVAQIINMPLMEYVVRPAGQNDFFTLVFFPNGGEVRKFDYHQDILQQKIPITTSYVVMGSEHDLKNKLTVFVDDLGLAVWPAHVLVVKGLGHEFRDAGVAFVGQRVLAHFVRPLGRYHLLEQFFIGLRLRLHHDAVLEFELNARYFRAVAIERLVEFDPAFGAAPIGRGKYFEARHIDPATGEPIALFTDAYPHIHITPDRMQAVYPRRKRIESALEFFYLGVDLLPALYRVCIIEKACLDYLVPVLFFRKSRFFRHRGSAVHCYRPRHLSFPLLLMPPVHEGLHRDPARHYLFGVYPVHQMHVLVRKDKERVVHLIDNSFQIFLRKEFDLAL